MNTVSHLCETTQHIQHRQHIQLSVNHQSYSEMTCFNKSGISMMMRAMIDIFFCLQKQKTQSNSCVDDDPCIT